MSTPARNLRRRHRDHPRRPAGAAAAAGEPDPPVAKAIEAQLRDGFRWLRFSPALEARFEAERGAGRRRQLSLVTLVGILIYSFLSINDGQVLPDVAQLSRVLAALMIPLQLGIALMVRQVRRGWLQEALVAACLLIVTGSVIYNISASRAPSALPHAMVLVLVPMFAGIAARLRFWYTLGISLLTLLGSVLMIRGHDAGGALIVEDFQAVLLSTIVFALIASYAVEHSERTAWLLGRLEQRRHTALIQANERLLKLSLRDSLTGIGNRRQFDLDLEARWNGGSGRPVALLLIDIDHFKSYNDRYGHPAGDACLQRVAGALQELAADCGGQAARLGGEEFAILLPAAGAPQVRQCAEFVRAQIEALAIPHEGAPQTACVTVSLGVAMAPPRPGDSRFDLIKSADRALYRAKTGGRNRVAMAEAVAGGVAA